MAIESNAAGIISMLGLGPHPEGGFYRETFRDDGAGGARAASTAIYFLLPQGVISRWHRVDAAEVWHWYAGSALDLNIAVPGATVETVRLGNNLSHGERPQAIVPAGVWQQAMSLGAWTLVGCTVAPGFSFDGFEIAADAFAP